MQQLPCRIANTDRRGWQSNHVQEIGDRIRGHSVSSIAPSRGPGLSLPHDQNASGPNGAETIAAVLGQKFGAKYHDVLVQNLLLDILRRITARGCYSSGSPALRKAAANRSRSLSRA